MTLAPRIWRDTMCRLQNEIPDFAFAAWILPLAVKIDRDCVVLGCPSSFHRDRVRIQYHESLERHLLAARRSESENHSEGKEAFSIELVSMSDFAERPGQPITVEIESDEVQTQASRDQRSEVGTERMMRSVARMHAAPALAVGENERLSFPGGARRVSRPAAEPGGDSTDVIRPTDASDADRAGNARLLAAVPKRAEKSTGKRKPRERTARVASSEPRMFGCAATEAEPQQAELPFSFESFVVGPCNALAREAALALARTRQSSLNLLYLGGESGMGKTHLARATAAEARRHDAPSSTYGTSGGIPSAGPRGPRSSRFSNSVDGRSIVYTSAEHFTSEFVSAMRNGCSDDFKRRYRGRIGLLVVEDIQFFSGRVKTQLELFHTLQHVLDAGGRVLLTGDRTPRDLTGLDERVRAQVGRGFVAELEPPDAIVRRHILRSKAAAGGVRLPADCLDLLVEASQGSVRDIESMLIQVVTTSSLLGRSIDIDLTRDAIALKSSAHTALTPKTIAISEIVQIVAAFFGKRPEALASRSRRRDVLIPRQLAMYLSHRYTQASFAEIGRGLGRGHPSVRNAVERIERQILENAPVRYQVEALSERIDHTLEIRKD